MKLVLRILGALILLAAGVLAVKKPELWDALSGRVLGGKQPGSGAYLVATEQLVRPWRLRTQIAGRPADMAIDPTGRFAAFLNGTSVVTVDLTTGIETGRVVTKTTSYLGIAFRPGHKEIWASEATRQGPDAVLRIPYTEDGKLLGDAMRRHAFPGHPIPAGLAFNASGSRLYVALHHDNAVATIDAANGAVLARWTSGLAPFAVVLDKAGKTLYVSSRAGAPRSSGAVAPSGKHDLPTDAAGSVLEGNVQIFDTSSGSAIASIPAGRATAGIALSPDGALLVATNAHSDSVTLIETSTRRATHLAIDGGSKALPGLVPNAVAFRADSKRFYVACGGENSVAVFDAAGSNWKLTGKLPAGWFPTALAWEPGKNELHIASVKGIGNDEVKEPPAGRHKSTVYEGILSSIPDPIPAQLAAGSREVAAAARPRFAPNGGVRDLHKLGIEHIFFIIKENRTYDQVLSDLPKGNRDPSLLMYGRDVTPNHHA